jgi:transposase
VSPEQKKLLQFAPNPAGTTIVNDRVLFRTERARRVISVHGIVFAHYDVTDRAAKAYAMISLFESGYADQNDIARCFGYSTRTLRRYQQHVEVDGLAGPANSRGRPPVKSSDRNKPKQLDRTVLHLKAQGFSNRVVAGRIGVDERTIRRHLRRLGWVEPSSESLPFGPEISKEETAVVTAVPTSATVLSDCNAPPDEEEADAVIEPAPKSFDLDPLDRSRDRLLASMGALEDAAPCLPA